METFASFLKGRRLPLLKFTSRKPSNGESETSGQEPLSDVENLHPSLMDPFSVKAGRGQLTDVAGKAVMDFANNSLHMVAVFNSVDEIVAEVVQTALQQVIQETWQELNQEKMVGGIISCVDEKETWGFVRSTQDDCHAEMVKPEQKFAAFAAKELIDVFLLELVIRKMNVWDSRFSEKERSSMVLHSLIFDILLRQFFSIQQQKQVTSENIPLRDFHLKAFTKVALDVILTELNKVVEEDMEDLLEYEREVQDERKQEYITDPSRS